MIAKQIKGKSFRGCVSYVLSKEGAEMIHSNMLGETVDELSREFGQTRKLKPNLEKCVYHASLSLPQGETLNKQQWGEISQKYMKEMGFEGSQFLSVIHKDTEHQHIHIIASRIRLDGTVVSDSHDYKRSEKVIRGFEIEYGLERVKPSRDVGISAPTRGELRKILKNRNPSIKMRLQKIISNATMEEQSMTSFINKLESEGVGVIANISEKTGHISGISFVLDGELMKGSDLGKSFTWGKLKEKGIKYECIREKQKIIDCGIRNREAIVERSYHKDKRTNERKHSSTESRSRKGFSKNESRSGRRAERNFEPNFKHQTRDFGFVSGLFKNDGEDRILSDEVTEQPSHGQIRGDKRKIHKTSNRNKLDSSFGADSFTKDLSWNFSRDSRHNEFDAVAGRECDEMGEVRGEDASEIQQSRSNSDSKDSRKRRLKEKDRRKAKSKKRGLDLGF